jgi:hypothetical protein
LNKNRVTDEQIEQALIASGGFISRSAEMLNMTQQGVRTRINKSPELLEIKASIRAKYLDLAESKVITAVNNGAPWAICFYLKCQGKERGWVETSKHEITGAEGGAIKTEEQKPDYSRLEKDELATLQQLFSKLYPAT